MKNLKKIIGLVLILSIVAVSAAGTQAQAISWKEWPYGKYKGVPSSEWDTFVKDNRIEWGYGSDVPDAYDESISMYKKGSKTRTEMSFKRVSKNKYKSKVYTDSAKEKYYCVIKLKGKYLYLYWYNQKKNGKYKKSKYVDKYKKYKSISKNVS